MHAECRAGDQAGIAALGVRRLVPVRKLQERCAGIGRDGEIRLQQAAVDRQDAGELREAEDAPKGRRRRGDDEQARGELFELPNQDTQARTVSETAVDERHDDGPSMRLGNASDGGVQVGAIESVHFSADVEQTNRADVPRLKASRFRERFGLEGGRPELGTPGALPGSDDRILSFQCPPLPDGAAGRQNSICLRRCSTSEVIIIAVKRAAVCTVLAGAVAKARRVPELRLQLDVREIHLTHECVPFIGKDA